MTAIKPLPRTQLSLIQPLFALGARGCVCMISRKWWNAWSRYVEASTADEPGFVDNTSLVYRRAVVIRIER